MKSGHLSEYFKQVAWKPLSAVDAEAHRSNQHEFGGVGKLRAIGDIAAVACAETGQVLSSYLDFLNKSMESDNAPVEAVVLSVIHALGGLGDKTAFDYLLYVTYLDYPQEVTDAARTALAQLKW